MDPSGTGRQHEAIGKKKRGKYEKKRRKEGRAAVAYLSLQVILMVVCL